jgi:hypothetical protein
MPRNSTQVVEVSNGSVGFPTRNRPALQLVEPHAIPEMAVVAGATKAQVVETYRRLTHYEALQIVNDAIRIANRSTY